MAASTPAYVNHRMLVWARETAGMDYATAAHHLQVAVERVVAWEAGQRLPTMRQARMLASLYRRPLSLLYFDDPPAEPPRPTDFRIAVPRGEALPAALRFALRDAHGRRQAAIRLLEGLGRSAKSPGLQAALDEDAEVVGERLRKWSRLTLAEQQGCGSPRAFYNLLRSKFENCGILTFQMTDVPERVATGFSLAESLFPTISVNNKTNPVRRLFTLFHELAHIALRQGGLCDLSDIGRDGPIPRAEVFCNRVAGAALVPRRALLGHPIVENHLPQSDWSNREIKGLAEYFQVSKYVALFRLRALNQTSEEFCQRRRSAFDKQETEESPVASFSRVHDKVASVNGQLFTRLVLDSYFNGQVSLRDVSDLLDLNLNYLDRLADKVYREAS